MKIYSIPILMYLACFMVSCGQDGSVRRFTAASPDRRMQVTVTWHETARRPSRDDQNETRLFYSVALQTNGGPMEVVLPSPLGLMRSDGDFAKQLKFRSCEKARPVEEMYSMTTGKRSLCTAKGNELVLNFKNADSARIQVVFRVFNDGVAFQYRFPDSTEETKSVVRELTGFRLPPNGKTFLQPYDPAGRFKPVYEACYQKNGPVGAPSPCGAGWSMPALFELVNGKAWVLLAESGLDRHYCGSHLDCEATGGLYRIRFPEEREARGLGRNIPSSRLPWSTPWRVIIAGTSPGRIVESTLVTDVGQPSILAGTAWIKPGRVSWSRWSDNESTKNYESLCHFIDLAGRMGWEYSLVDATWSRMDSLAVPRLVQAAAEKNVGILLWYNAGGSSNNVPDEPRDRMSDRNGRRREFAWLKETGVKGVKVDFFQSDKQHIVGLAQDILEDAAEYKLMVNFHGCTAPRGWFRTYPHLMTMEAVRGAETYRYDPAYTGAAPWHNTVLPFTRNAVGSMDCTPVTFSDNRYPHQTTWGHELALSVVFESGWQHFADRAEAYLNLPRAPKEFLRIVPASWDDIRFLDGNPGSRAVLARKKGEDWFIGGINGENRKTETEFKFDFLESRFYIALVINDSGFGNGFVDWKTRVSAADSIRIPMMAYGGFVVHVRPE